MLFSTAADPLYLATNANHEHHPCSRGIHRPVSLIPSTLSEYGASETGPAKENVPNIERVRGE